MLPLAVLPLGGTATADGLLPGAGEVQAARATAAQRAAQVTAVEQQLAAAQAAERELDVRAEEAVEKYNGALVRRQSAQTGAVRAAEAAAQAESDRQSAGDAADVLAAEQYRMGVPPALVALDGVLQAGNMSAANTEHEILRSVSAQADSVVSAAGSTAARAAAASQEAFRAAALAQQATTAVQSAEKQVLAQLAAQRTQVAAIDAQHTALLAALAAAQQISVDLAARRQQALAAEAARAAAEAARQAALQAPAPGGPDGSSDPAPAGDAAAVVAYARAQVGLPYVWGAAGPRTFDCSGLTMRAWERAGITLPHFAADQYVRSRPVSYSQLRPGDLVFWSHDGSPGDIYHVAVYIGDDQMIEAPRTGMDVKIASLWIMGTPNFYARP